MAERRATLGKADKLLEEGFKPVRDDGGGQWIYSDDVLEGVSNGETNEGKTSDETSGEKTSETVENQGKLLTTKSKKAGNSRREK